MPVDFFPFLITLRRGLNPCLPNSYMLNNRTCTWKNNHNLRKNVIAILTKKKRIELSLQFKIGLFSITYKEFLAVFFHLATSCSG